MALRWPAVGFDEEPVFLSYRGGADGVFDSVVVNLDLAVGEEVFEGGPLLEGVGDGFAHCALREVGAGGCIGWRRGFGARLWCFVRRARRCANAGRLCFRVVCVRFGKGADL